jgi:hypothetical protein
MGVGPEASAFADFVIFFAIPKIYLLQRCMNSVRIVEVKAVDILNFSAGSRLSPLTFPLTFCRTKGYDSVEDGRGLCYLSICLEKGYV